MEIMQLCYETCLESYAVTDGECQTRRKVYSIVILMFVLFPFALSCTHAHCWAQEEVI